MSTMMDEQISAEQSAFYVADLAMHGYCVMPDGTLTLNSVVPTEEEAALPGGPLELAAAEQVYV
jgi:hypothetical protein